ncbi:MAG: type IX secretion system sortase PorU [Candidatus Eisenbacteria bacterium]|nr:type IX secretion system sortase PorU [Candidatus Eisenbacteria bacterium]
MATSKSVRPLAASLLLALAVASPLGASAQAGFEPVRLLRSDSGAIEFEVTVPEPFFVTRETEQGEFRVMRLPGFFSHGRPGEAELPHRTFMVGVPADCEYEVTVTSLEEVGLPAVRILPAPVLSEAEDGTSEERFVPSERFYGTDAFLPARPLLGVSDSWMRHQRVLGIDVCPVRYNPGSGALVLLKRIRVTVSLSTAGAAGPEGVGGRAPVQAAPAEDGLEGLYKVTLVNYEQAREWRGRLVPRPVSQAGDSFGSSPNWCKIGVNDRGVYRVTGADLAAAGVTDLGSVNPLTLRLFNGGGVSLDPSRTVSEIAPWMTECAVMVEDGGDGRFDSQDYVLFYGMGLTGWQDYFDAGAPVTYVENEYSDTNVYWLTWNGSFSTNPDPLRAAQKSGEPVTAGAYVPQSHPARVHMEENREYDSSLHEAGQRWEKWWWATLSNPGGTGATSFLYTFGAPQAEPTSPCSLAVRLWAPCTRYSTWCATESHTAAVTLNRRSIDQESWVGFNVRKDLTGWSPTSQETDSLVITVAAPRDALYLAWYELFYEKRFAADPLSNNSVAFTSPDTTGVVHYSVSGLGGTGGLLLLDVTDYYSPKSITGYLVNEVMGTYTVEFEDTLDPGERRHYLLLNSSALKTPESVALRQFDRRLRDVTNGADYVMVVHEALASGVDGLADLRETSLSGVADPVVLVAATEEIYDEFAWGLEDPCAIRDFLMYAYWNWTGVPRPLSYVLLAGDATYDFKDYYHYGLVSLVPTWEGTYDFIQTESQLVNDDFFALLDGGNDKLLDVCLGRSTFQTLAEANSIVNGKIVPYASSPTHGIWRNKAILVADDNTICGSPETLGYDHIIQTELVAAQSVPEVLDPHKIYLSEFRYDTLSCYKSQAKAEFLSDFSDGALIVNYIGHGNWNQLAHEQVFQIRDVASLSNAGKLALFFAGSCKVAKFDEPFEEGLGEALLKSSEAGAVASVAATGLVYSWSNFDFNNQYYTLLFPDGAVDSLVPVGVALMATKNYLASSYDDTLNSKRYVLMGDPALLLAAPELGVRLDAATVDTLLQGEVVAVSGEVVEDGGRAGWYDGTADVLVSGTEMVRKPTAAVTFTLPGGPIFHGAATVRQGAFDFTFVVPTDASVVGPTGRVRGYSMNSVDGTGITYPVVIGAGSGASSDTIGPTVSLRFDDGAVYVPSRSVLHITLTDEHGIGATGLTVTSSILLQIDKSLQPADLTSSFVYSPDSYQTGVIDYTLPPLSSGPHTALLVCYDNLGNRGSAELKFDIVESGALALKDVLNYPNPFEEETYLIFELTSDAVATIKIYTVSGKLVRELCQGCAVRRGNNQFRWDGRDAEGHAVANGVYLYLIEVSDSQGKKDSFIGRAALLK